MSVPLIIKETSTELTSLPFEVKLEEEEPIPENPISDKVFFLIFVILFLIIITVFVFLLYFANRAADKQLASQVKAQPSNLQKDGD